MPLPLLIAGIAAGTSILSVMGANKADKEAADLEKFQNLIDVEKFAGDMALASYNATLEQGIAESEQTAIASAMGKRSQGGSQANIKKVGRDTLKENITRTEREVARARKYGKISNNAIDKRTKAKAASRSIGTVSSGLMSLGKAY